MRSLDDDILCSQVPRPGPGCGYTECAHCDTPPAPPPARSLRQPPPLPPKPPWLRPTLVGSAVPRSRPASYNENISSLVASYNENISSPAASYNENISSPAASYNESSSETTETSCSTEQESSPILTLIIIITITFQEFILPKHPIKYSFSEQTR